MVLDNGVGTINGCFRACARLFTKLVVVLAMPVMLLLQLLVVPVPIGVVIPPQLQLRRLVLEQGVDAALPLAGDPLLRGLDQQRQQQQQP